MTDDKDETQEAIDETDAPPPDEPRPPTTWKEARAEIAREPGNHGSFAFGCSLAVVVALVAFFVVRVLLMR